MNVLNIQPTLRKSSKKDPTVYVRVTVNSEPSILKSLKEKVPPEKWDKHKGRVSGSTKEAIRINTKIDRFVGKVNAAFKKIDSDKHLTGQELREAFYNKKPQGKYNLLSLYLDWIEYRRTTNVQESTVKLDYNVYRFIKKIIKEKYGKDDISINELDAYFLVDFVEFRYRRRSTLKVYLSKLKKFFKYVREKDLRLKVEKAPNPINFDTVFIQPDLGEIKTKPLRELIQYHTPEEQEIIKSKYEETKDRHLAYYLLQVYTGMAYADLAEFKSTEHILMRNGEPEIRKRRSKYKDETSIETIFIVPLSDEALDIIDEFGDFLSEGRDMANEYKCYRYELMKTGKELGFQLSTHKPRHTFAINKLNEGYRLESVQKMMGHRDIKSTQIYAKMMGTGIYLDKKRIEQERNNM